MLSAARETWRDLRTLRVLVRPRVRQRDLPGRLDAFYRDQAADYDRFRARLLPGRRELIESLPWRRGGVWVDLGGGTASNLEHVGGALSALAAVHVVDLSAALLDVARRRCDARGWSRVSLHRADAAAVPLPDGCADVVTCSYALTMMPDWFAVVDEACRLLKPGGTFGSVDFYVSRGMAAPLTQHSVVTRRLWPWWFGHSHVHLNPDHLPYLQRRFSTRLLVESRTRLPYVPIGRAPYYRFIGTTPVGDGATATRSQ